MNQQIKKSDGNPSKQLSVIHKVGSLEPVQFARTVLDYKKIRDMESTTARQILGAVFSQAANFAGIKNEIDELNKQDISEMILSTFNGLSIQEVFYAFKMERYGNLGDKTEHYQLFNADFVSRVLNKYKKWLQETRVSNNLPVAKTQPKAVEMTEEEKDNLTYMGVVNCFDAYVQNRSIIPGYNWVYDHLDKLGILVVTTSAKKASVKFAEEQLRQEAKAMDPHPARKLLEQLEQKNSAPAIVRAKNDLVAEYFDKVIEKGLHISSLIKNK